MVVSDLVNLSSLLDDAKCFALIREYRWPAGVRCPDCDSPRVIRNHGCSILPTGYGESGTQHLRAKAKLLGSKGIPASADL
jgi:hypothetical protein